MYCIRCGSQLPDGAGVCSACGRSTRTLLTRCYMCKAIILFGPKTLEDTKFCSYECLQRHWHSITRRVGFCDRCLEQTSNEAMGGSYSADFIFGTRPMVKGSGDLCPSCKSVVMRNWFWLFVPLVPGPDYRVIFVEGDRLGPGTYISRKVKA